MILIKANGGLGNRMLSAASVILYANATKRPWSIDWSDGLYANQSDNAYALLFQTHNKQQIAKPFEQDFDSVIPTIWNKRIESSPHQLMCQYYPGQHSSPLVYRKMSSPITAKPKENQLEVFWSYTSKFGRVKQYLSKDNRDRDTALSYTLKSYFQPNDSVIRKVAALVDQTGGKTLGVHIRYTDLKVPIQKVIDKVRKCITTENYSNIFLATDSEYAQTIFTREFENVLVNEKFLSKENEQLHTYKESDNKLGDSNSALVDMMMLAHCDALVYHSRSKFAETSRLLGGFKSEQLFDLDQYNPMVRFKRFMQEYI